MDQQEVEPRSLSDDDATHIALRKALEEVSIEGVILRLRHLALEQAATAGWPSRGGVKERFWREVAKALSIAEQRIDYLTTTQGVL
jgi:hypothetical protein